MLRILTPGNIFSGWSSSWSNLPDEIYPAHCVFFLLGLSPLDFFFKDSLVTGRTQCWSQHSLSLGRDWGLPLILAFTLERQRSEASKKHLRLRTNTCWRSSWDWFTGSVEVASWPSLSSGVWKGRADRSGNTAPAELMANQPSFSIQASRCSLCKMGRASLKPSSGVVPFPQESSFVCSQAARKFWGVGLTLRARGRYHHLEAGMQWVYGYLTPGEPVLHKVFGFSVPLLSPQKMRTSSWDQDENSFTWNRGDEMPLTGGVQTSQLFSPRAAWGPWSQETRKPLEKSGDVSGKKRSQIKPLMATKDDQAWANFPHSAD